MSISLQLLQWLLKAAKIKEFYDRPVAEIEEAKKKQNQKRTFSVKPLKGQSVKKFRISGRDVLIVSNKENLSHKALLYLYGGGFSSEISSLEKRASVQYGTYSGREVWIPRYPNVMDDGNTIRELYQMVLETYRKMLDTYRPEDIAVIGFSAGATLGIGMFEYNNTLEEPLPVPELLIASSPACIPATDAEREKVKQLADQDLMIPASFVHSIKETMCHGQQIPAWMYEITTGDLSHMPKTHIYYGSNEVLYACADSLCAAFAAAGSPCELHVGQGLFHCYPAIRSIPECREAFDEIVGYLKH